MTDVWPPFIYTHYHFLLDGQNKTEERFCTEWLRVVPLKLLASTFTRNEMKKASKLSCARQAVNERKSQQIPDDNWYKDCSHSFPPRHTTATHDHTKNSYLFFSQTASSSTRSGTGNNSTLTQQQTDLFLFIFIFLSSSSNILHLFLSLFTCYSINHYCGHPLQKK